MSTWSFEHATVDRVIDGDTVALQIDLGFEVTKRGSFRLIGINAIELNQPGGKEARANLAELLPVGTPVTLHSVKDDKYGGRYLAAIYKQGLAISAILVSTGWAASPHGHTPPSHPCHPHTHRGGT